MLEKLCHQVSHESLTALKLGNHWFRVFTPFAAGLSLSVSGGGHLPCTKERHTEWSGTASLPPRAYTPSRLAERTLCFGHLEGEWKRRKKVASSGYEEKRLSGKAGNVPDLERWMNFG